MLEIFDSYRPELAILASLVLALLFGGIIGFERENADKPAGLRTHMLVAVAAALLVGLSDVVVMRLDEAAVENVVRTDPIRIFEAIITGVAFLGAGTIIRREKDHVEGLTTAASLLFTAGVGAAVALHQFVVAVGATVLALVILRLVGRLQARVTES